MTKKQFYRLLMITLMTTLLMSITFARAEWKETDISNQVPLPKDITIVPPPPDLPKELAAFSGRWEGIWEAGSLPAILIVEEINLKEAKVINAWAKAVYYQADYKRYIAKVVGKEIQFRSACQFKFIVDEDSKTIHGERVCPGGGISSKIKMKKIE